MPEATFTTRPLCVWRVHGVRDSRFECRPISDAPTEGTVSIMYRRQGGKLHQCGVGSFIGGVWVGDAGKPLDADGLCWTRFVDDNG
jgi:hypothetical protein